jgi:hypothetical protein
MVETWRDLQDLIDTHSEWLLVRENGTTFSLGNSEIEFSSDANGLMLGVVDDGGFTFSRITSAALESNELTLAITGRFRKTDELLRFVPRTPASVLSANIELARLEEANRLAQLLVKTFPQYTVKRVALNRDNSRLAQINCEKKGQRIIVLCDLTSSMSAEAMLSSAITALSESRRRARKPAGEVWIVAGKKHARSLQRMRALLTSRSQSPIRIFEKPPETSELPFSEKRRIAFSHLWREKPSRLSIPPKLQFSETANAIGSLAPDQTDVIFSKQGETIRYNGLAIARVRTLLGKEMAWFGIDKDRRMLSEDNHEDLETLVSTLSEFRSGECENKRHELYRLAPEAWLESILRRNIRSLDANLILSPIYNQFRTASDKIDLLAIRKDGRLVIIELKTSPDREMVFQAADYWRKIELQRRKGVLAKAKLFGDVEIIDKPALVYAVAPALNFHRDFDEFAQMMAPEIELWRFELHENWRKQIKVVSRRDQSPRTNL